MGNVLEHYKYSNHKGCIIGMLSIIPDLFMVMSKITFGRIRQFCRNMHNTHGSIVLTSLISKRLGIAWQLHRELDRKSHKFQYELWQNREDAIPNDSVLLLSGGLDSFIIWRLLGMPKAIYFKIGHVAEKWELERIMKLKKDFDADIIIEDRLQLSDIEQDNGYILYRNLLFILFASYYSPNVIIGQILEDAPDKNVKFYKQVEKIIGAMSKGSFQDLRSQTVKIHAPFKNYIKTMLVARYVAEFGSKDLLNYTVSCYKGNWCGKCSACLARYIAMENNGISEKYKRVPNVGIIKHRWSIKDVKLRNMRMYLGRYLEMRRYL